MLRDKRITSQSLWYSGLFKPEIKTGKYPEQKNMCWISRPKNEVMQVKYGIGGWMVDGGEWCL